MTDDTSWVDVLEQLTNYVNLGLEWGIKQFKSACPPNIKLPKKKCIKSKSETVEEDVDIGSPCMEKKSYITSNQFCPKTTSCCYIKMQDPYALPCCEPEKQKLPPCPKCHAKRKLNCSCDLCKTGTHKCCRDKHSPVT